jgi:ribokinase
LPAELLTAVDILTPNETEAAILAGAPCGDLSFEGAAAIAADFIRGGVKAVIVKMGARGCLLSCGPQTLALPAPAMNVVDTTAAGDVFNAALGVALAEGAALEQAAAFAVRASALSVTRYGAQPSTPTRPEVAESASSDRACDWFAR